MCMSFFGVLNLVKLNILLTSISRNDIRCLRLGRHLRKGGHDGT